MGQSVTRVNDRDAVPGTSGVYDRPIIGVGRPVGQHTPPDSHAEPAPHKKTALPEPSSPKSQTSAYPITAPISPTNEEKEKGFRGRLKNGWQTTIGVFKRKHETPSGGEREEFGVAKTTTPPTTLESTTIPVAAPGKGMSPTTRARSLSEEMNNKENEKMASNKTAPVPQSQRKETTWQETTPLAAGMSVSGINNEKPQSSGRSPNAPQRQLGQQSGNMSLWWQAHRPVVDQVLPPTLSPMITQPDELHREPVDIGGTTGSFDETIPAANLGRKRSGSGASPLQVGQTLDRHQRMKSVLPPSISPMVATVDELHREPAWPPHRQKEMAMNPPTNYSGHHHDKSGLPPAFSPMVGQIDELHREPAWPPHHAENRKVPPNWGGGGGSNNEKNKSQTLAATQKVGPHYWPPV